MISLAICDAGRPLGGAAVEVLRDFARRQLPLREGATIIVGWRPGDEHLIARS